MAASMSNSLVVTRTPQLHPSTGSSLKQVDKCLKSAASTSVSFGLFRPRKMQLTCSTKPFTVQASYRDDGRPSGGSIFVSGFVLGGLVVGALGCIYAPQISRALADTDREELLRKLPKFISDEKKVLEKTRNMLTEKIQQLNTAIDDFSGRLRTEGKPNRPVAYPDEIETGV